jgi:hypothetical protein
LVVAAEGEVPRKMALRLRLSWLLATENRRSAILTPLWAVAITMAYAQALFQRAYMTIFDYAIVIAICIVAGIIIMDVGRAILSYIAAIAIGGILLLVLVSIPANASTIPSPGNIVFPTLWITILFTAFFPLPFTSYLVATVVGAAIGERYL